MTKSTELATQQTGVATKPTTPQQVIKQFFTADSVQNKFKELLGKKAQGFVASVLQVVNANDYLQKADPKTIYQAAMMAATLDLPINQNLGFAYIIPYGTSAQFQMGYKGFIQLAQRSGQFKTISAAPIYEGQLIEENPLTGFVFDFTKKKSEKIVGYAAYFELLNGFQKTLYMTETELKAHGTRFSQTFKRGSGLWKDDFNSMALKTVIKLLLSKFAPLSIEMQRAVITDQSIINDVETEDVTYVDNTYVEEPEAQDPIHGRISLMIGDAQTIEDLQAIEKQVPDEMTDLFTVKMDELKAKK